MFMNGLVEIEKRIQRMLKIINDLKKENISLKEKIKKLENETYLYQKESEDILLTIDNLIKKENK